MQRITIERRRGAPINVPRNTIKPGELLMDAQTLRDLEIFDGLEGRPGWFRLFDRARSRGGANVLRARFLAPMSDATRIREVQTSLRFILDHLDLFDRMPGQYALAAYDHYFHGRLPPPVHGNAIGATVDAVQLLLESYPDYTQIARGVRQTVHTIRTLRQIVNDPAVDQAPGELGSYLSEIRSLLDRPALKALPHAAEERWHVVRLLRVDRVLRDGEMQALDRVRDLVFEIDALASMARATREYGFVFPEVVEGPPQAVGEGLFHPILDDPVRNPLVLEQPRRLLLLTGPNMAGKTTYLRAAGIAIYLAHLGMGVPATSFRFAPCDALFTAITLSDNVHVGISFFEAEALRARAVAEAVAAGFRVVALLDEPFKGTNVKDALDASCAYLSRLATRPGNLFLVASHLIEAAEPLLATGCVDCRRFEATDHGGHLEFDYELRPGVSSQRLGMRVLEEKGVFQVLDDARAGNGRPPASE